MPIYEYICQTCAEEIEVLQQMNAAGPDCCPNCDGVLERQYSRTNSNFGKHSSRTAERHSKLTMHQQAKQELDRLSEHSKKTGIPLDDLFEVH
jgi:putative FmdB family regulatory protein